MKALIFDTSYLRGDKVTWEGVGWQCLASIERVLRLSGPQEGPPFTPRQEHHIFTLSFFSFSFLLFSINRVLGLSGPNKGYHYEQSKRKLWFVPNQNVWGKLIFADTILKRYMSPVPCHIEKIIAIDCKAWIEDTKFWSATFINSRTRFWIQSSTYRWIVRLNF